MKEAKTPSVAKYLKDFDPEDRKRKASPPCLTSIALGRASGIVNVQCQMMGRQMENSAEFHIYTVM